MTIHNTRLTKLQYIQKGEHLESLCNDSSRFIRNKAKVRTMELKIEQTKAELLKKEETEPDIFENIVLGSKTKEEKLVLIKAQKHLIFFARDDDFGVRLLAKKELSILRNNRNHTARMIAQSQYI